MTLRTIPLALILAVAAAPLPAQQRTTDVPRAWTTARVAKWALLGVAVGFGAYALAQSHHADRAYADLNSFCRADADRCTLSDGRYADAAAERMYAQVTHHDQHAQLGILGGQVALLGSASFFIYDLRHGREPVNIPYPPGRAQRELVVGVRLAF